jgi:CRP-like cAMP-binding protein
VEGLLDYSFVFEALLKRWDRRVAISKDDRDALIGLPWSHRGFGREAYIVREGEPTSTCGLLVSGFVFRQKLVSDGARQIISFHIPGEFFDLQNSMLDVADHNVQSLNRASVAMVHRNALLELMSERPNIRRAIWLDSLIDASVFREWVVNVGRRDARARIAHLLCELADRLRASGVSNGELYDFPVTQEQIGDATGLTAVHTNRTLQSLRKDGLISLSSSQLTILDWESLADIGDFSERYLHHAV